MADDESGGRAALNTHDELLALRSEFERSTPSLQRFALKIRCYLGAPITSILVTAGAVAWALFTLAVGRPAVDPSPFPLLNTLATVAALIATILILAGQRREDEAAKRISRLTLHMAAESEQKIAKLIQLVEEQRRDSTAMRDRYDAEAEQMGSPIQPRQVLQRLEDGEGL